MGLFDRRLKKNELVMVHGRLARISGFVGDGSVDVRFEDGGSDVTVFVGSVKKIAKAQLPTRLEGGSHAR